MTEALNLLNPRALDMRNPGGGRPELTAQDIAAALSGLKKAPYYLGMLVYAFDEGAFNYLYVQVAGMKQIPKKPQGLTGYQPVKQILLLCLDELWGDNKCGTCKGAGVNNEQQECQICRGRKYKVFTELSRSRQASIPWQYWPKYQGFYQRLYIQLTDWDCQIRSHLRTRLEDEQFHALPQVRTEIKDRPFMDEGQCQTAQEAMCKRSSGDIQ